MQEVELLPSGAVVEHRQGEAEDVVAGAGVRAAGARGAQPLLVQLVQDVERRPVPVVVGVVVVVVVVCCCC